MADWPGVQTWPEDLRRSQPVLHSEADFRTLWPGPFRCLIHWLVSGWKYGPLQLYRTSGFTTVRGIEALILPRHQDGT
jgi:hypothetical protein